MPGAVPITSTPPLTQRDLPCVARLVNQGAAAATQSDPGLLGGLSVTGVTLPDKAVDRDQGRERSAPKEAIGLSTFSIPA
jgi:alanine dehydrogenase